MYRVMTDGHRDNSVGERKLIWDEENRLLAVDDNGFVSNYWYDADGERTVKTSGESDHVYVNGIFSGGSTNTAKFSLYVSPYLVANQGGRYTKHIYAGSQRIVSKVGDFASYGSDPRRIEYAGANTDGLSVDYKSKYAAQQQVIKDNYKFFDVPYNGTDNDNYADGEGFCCNDGSMEAAVAQARKAQTRAVSRSFKDPDNYENLQFFYHLDHLGSSSFITNLDGDVVQHIEYVPFGEVFIEERNNVWNTPYLFNAKEFDEETGMYYYGARYYDPRLSLWMSTDPLHENYPNISSYLYCHNNPVILIDPSGMADEESQKRALSEIDNFASQSTSSVFQNIPKDDFVKSLKNHIQNPRSVNQGSNGCCGAAAISKYMAEERPELYVQTAISLYTTGTASNNDVRISVTNEMKTGTTNELRSAGMTSADAIVQGAIINSANSVLSFNPFKAESGLNTLMTPGKVESFLTNYVGATVRTISPYPTHYALRQTNYSKFFVIGLVHHGSESITNPTFAIPNHYVQLTGITGNKVSYWTWGESKDRASSILGHSHGIFQIFIINR